MSYINDSFEDAFDNCFHFYIMNVFNKKEMDWKEFLHMQNADVQNSRLVFPSPQAATMFRLRWS